MRPVIIKAYGALSPASEETLQAVRAVLETWFIEEDAAELNGNMVTIGYEGDAFPDDEVVDALKPYLCDTSWGKLDIIDLEAWTLHRYTFTNGQLSDHTATLDKAMDPCALH
ncbi:MAG: hypothetical protein IJ034_01390 [Mailhella sp.]|nr:hypothetical protein [Mailhella sp.]MBQ8744152.1 hypothetical protein [Mailhella sp.]